MSPSRRAPRAIISLTALAAACAVAVALGVFNNGGLIPTIWRHAIIPAPPSYTVSVAPQIPVDFRTQLVRLIEGQRVRGAKEFRLVDSAAADLRVGVAAAPGPNQTALYSSYLIPVGHPYWIRDDIASADLKSGSALATPSDRGLVDQVLGFYAPGAGPSTSTTDLPSALLGQENQVGLVDFSELSNSLKVLQLDGSYFFDNPGKGGLPYSVVVTASAKLEGPKGDLIATTLPAFPPPFDPSRLLVMDQTGTTAITRALGLKIDQSGQSDYASQRIAPFFKGADIVHISNEVAFVDHCNPIGSDTTFCARPNYIANLKAIGVNVVELTGNHQNDYGADWDAKTIQTYTQQGWSYFGGGSDGTDAAKVLYKDIKGTKLAFLGYNYYDTVHNDAEIATDPGHAGANSWSPEKVKTDIAAARAAGAQQVIVDFQYTECYAYTEGNTECYAPISNPDQVTDFRAAIDDGADIVVGTQAHQPQTYEIYKGKSIFYGLGNLFFDQWEWTGTRQGVILTHYFYGGRYLSTRMTTTDYDTSLQVYVSSGADRLKLLNDLAAARVQPG